MPKKRDDFLACTTFVFDPVDERDLACMYYAGLPRNSRMASWNILDTEFGWDQGVLDVITKTKAKPVPSFNQLANSEFREFEGQRPARKPRFWRINPPSAASPAIGASLSGMNLLQLTLDAEPVTLSRDTLTMAEKWQSIAPIVNTRGPLFVHPKGIVKRTHFHAMAMYANELEPRVGKLSLEAGDLRHGNRSIPVLDGVATVDESGKKWAVALVNRHPAKPVACTVRMKDRLLDGQFAALVLAGDSPEAFNDIENSNRVTPQKTTLTFIKGAVNLPPHSLTIVKVPPK